jgi:hypothetical protein
MACAAANLDARGARLLHHSTNAVYHLPAENAVARVTIAPDAAVRIPRVVAAARWLVGDHHFPATRPLPGAEPVIREPDTVVSFWIYYPPPEPVEPLTSTHLAALLRTLHQIEAAPPLPAWVPLASLSGTIADPALSASLTGDERHWLQDRIEHLLDELANLDWPLGVGIIHGDAWAGNLLPAPGTPPVNAVLGDWDWVSMGPREVDLIPTWHAATRYGKGAAWSEAFAHRYGYDLACWEGFRTVMDMRDLVQLTGPLRRAGASPRHRAALRQRLRSLRAGDTTARWVALAVRVPPGG